MGKSSPCLSKTDNLCCSQWTSTTIFTSQQTKRKFKIYHKVNCKKERVIYLMECTLYHKQCLGNVETAFNVRLNNHRKDTKNPNIILACSNFQQQDHSFNSHAKFIVIDKLFNTFSFNDIFSKRLIQRKTFGFRN